jgi:hypothetical protein
MLPAILLPAQTYLFRGQPTKKMPFQTINLSTKEFVYRRVSNCYFTTSDLIEKRVSQVALAAHLPASCAAMPGTMAGLSASLARVFLLVRRKLSWIIQIGPEFLRPVGWRRNGKK